MELSQSVCDGVPQGEGGRVPKKGLLYSVQWGGGEPREVV